MFILRRSFIFHLLSLISSPQVKALQEKVGPVGPRCAEDVRSEQANKKKHTI